MYLERIRRSTPATLSVVFSGDETPVDADGIVTVLITDVDGAEVASGSARRTGVGAYAFDLAGQSRLNDLTVYWSAQFDGNATTITTYVEIVGDEYFTISELRGYDSVLLNTVKYPYLKLVSARAAVEAEFEGICGRAFVPRYAREVVFGDGTVNLSLAFPEPLRVVSCFVNGDDWSAKVFSRPDDNLRVLSLAPDAEPFPRNSRVVIEYEYGKDCVPLRIKNAALKRTKYALVADQSRIDERATTMNVPDFGNFVLATPGMRGSYTGIPEVDVVLLDYVIGTL